MAEDQESQGKAAATSGAKSIDPAALEMIKRAEEKSISTMFSRVDSMKPCPIGAEGACCRICSMGPCRISGKDKEGKTGICGANIETIAARNFARQVAAGASAHSDHGRAVALTLLAAAKGEAPGYKVKDEIKLFKVAGLMGIDTEGREINDIAADVAQEALDNFGRQTGELTYVARAPEKRQEIWRKLGIVPRGVDREVVETLHRTHAGTDQDYDHILDHSMRCALGSGWGGSMLATDLQDILFGTPTPLRSKANLGVLKADEVNIIMHGHEPTLSELIVDAAQDPEMIKYAESKGAKGINLAGICCTSNEVLMRRGVPPAGNVLHQELAIITGAVDAMVVDVQCTFQGLVAVAKNFHTKIISTNEKAKIEGATHIEFDEHRAPDVAKEIVKTAIDNFPNRGKDVAIPAYTSDVVVGFSHEYIRYMLGGKHRASFRALNDAIISGRIQGAAGIVGCNNPRVTQDEGIIHIARRLIANDVLVVVTGCAAIASGKHGLLTPETMEHAGPGLREICETTGMPPILHLGSCVDNTRILTILSEVVAEGGLGEDISDLPAVGICPEWYCEKALEIAVYCVASGAYVLFGGVGSPVEGTQKLVDYMIDGWEAKTGGKLEFISDPQGIVDKTLDHIAKKRKALKIDVAKERVLYDMEMRRELSV